MLDEDARRELLLSLTAFFDEAPLYNPTKHGMGVTAASDALFAIDGTAMAHGPAVTVLEIVDKNDRTGPRWRHTTRWFDFEHHEAFTYCAIILMRQLWVVGSWLYTGSTHELYIFFERPLFRVVQDAAHRNPQVKASFDLLYERPLKTGKAAPQVRGIPLRANPSEKGVAR